MNNFMKVSEKMFINMTRVNAIYVISDTQVNFYYGGNPDTDFDTIEGDDAVQFIAYLNSITPRELHSQRWYSNV